jgi:hypothetical protein
MRVRLRSSQEAEKPDVHSWLRPGEDYAVLAIEHLPGGVPAYRIASRQGTPALFEASLFSIIDPHVDEGWVVQYNESGEINLVPEAWNLPGFWEDYFEGKPDAVGRYQEVLCRASSADQ